MAKPMAEMALDVDNNLCMQLVHFFGAARHPKAGLGCEMAVLGLLR